MAMRMTTVRLSEPLYRELQRMSEHAGVSIAQWLRERTQTAPFTTRQLAAELVVRGIKTDRRAVWTFLHSEGLSFKKNDRPGRAGSA